MISVIVPVYNSEKYLHRCVDSILAQTITDFELLLINDGSTDSSGAICNEYAQKDSRVRVFHKENCGVSSARNIGIKESQGNLLLMLDSDDWLALNTLDVLLKEQKKNNSDCVIFGFNQTSGNIWAPTKNQCYNSIDELKQNFVYHLNTELLSTSVNKLYKKQLIKNLYPENTSFGEDLIFSLDYIEGCKQISFIQDALYQHDVSNNSSITHRFDINRFKDIERIQQRILSFAIDKNAKGLYDKYVADCVRVIRGLYKSELSYKEKKYAINSWLDSSYLLKGWSNKWDVVWQNKLLLLLVKYRCFVGIDLLVNWRNYLKLK